MASAEGSAGELVPAWVFQLELAIFLDFRFLQPEPNRSGVEEGARA